MQTALLPELLNTPEGARADAILRSCVHCGFCTATCPTYQLLGDELDGPRGRIYQIKQALEGQNVTRETQKHLDRCLTCRSCETTCPSGVAYGELVDIGREFVDAKVKRPYMERAVRFLLRLIVPNPKLFTPLLRIGQILRPLMPSVLAKKTPLKQVRLPAPAASNHARKMILLDGCAQKAATPNTNLAARHILNDLGIETIMPAAQGCCGAVSQHLSAPDQAQDFMRRNIDACWPYIEQGAKAIISTASGCGVLLKDYGHLLAQDTAYAAKAARFSALVRDVGEILLEEDLSQFKLKTPRKIAFHAPCTLQHGQQLQGKYEKMLADIGFELTKVKDSHLCCGSAGTYSVLQPKLAKQLRNNKLQALKGGDLIATANIGCQLHLQTGTDQKIVHWLELLYDASLNSKI